MSTQIVIAVLGIRDSYHNVDRRCVVSQRRLIVAGRSLSYYGSSINRNPADQRIVGPARHALSAKSGPNKPLRALFEVN